MRVLKQFRLKERTAIVTGGARGLGKSMAKALASAGANIAIVDKNSNLVEKTAREIKEFGVDTLAMEVNIKEEKEVKNMVSRVRNTFGDIEILLNNAGICKNYPAEHMSFEDWNEVIDVNLSGMFLCSREVGKIMIKQKIGSIINISSMSGLIVNYPQPQVAYNSSKAGVIQLTKSLAAEWAQYNIRVNAIAPGYMGTEMTKKYLKNHPQVKEKWIDSTPMQRMGEPDELQGAVVYLASEASSFMTGHTIVIDGGYCIL